MGLFFDRLLNLIKLSPKKFRESLLLNTIAYENSLLSLDKKNWKSLFFDELLAFAEQNLIFIQKYLCSCV